MTPGVQTPGSSPGNCGRGQSPTRRGGQESETPRRRPPSGRTAGLQPRMQTNLGVGRCASWGRCPGEAGPQVGRELGYALGWAPTLTPPPGCLGQTHIPAPYGPWLPPTALLPRPFIPAPRPTSLGHAHSPRPPPVPSSPAPIPPLSRPYPALSAPWHRPRPRPAPRPVASPARRRGRRCAPFEVWRRAGGWCCVREDPGEERPWRLCDLGARRAAGGGRALVEARATRCGGGGPVSRGRRDRSAPEPPQA